MDSTHHQRPAGVARSLQVTQDPVRAAASQARDVLSHHPMRSKLGDEARHVGPQARARAFNPSTTAGKAAVLAGEAAAHQPGPRHPVGVQPGGMESADIGVGWDAGPVPGEYLARKAVGLAEGNRLQPGPVQIEAETADAAEQVEDWRASLECFGGGIGDAPWLHPNVLGFPGASGQLLVET